tara:strand:+ start:142 stop:444 length:303 start_codon:yes stop_codon:yes gene_type:complete
MNKDLKYMPIDNRAGSWASKHMSPIFQTTSRSNSVGGLKTSGGRNNIYLNDKGQTQQEVMKLAKEDYLAADESKKDERYDNFVDKADSITKVNLTPPKKQ